MHLLVTKCLFDNRVSGNHLYIDCLLCIDHLVLMSLKLTGLMDMIIESYHKLN